MAPEFLVVEMPRPDDAAIARTVEEMRLAGFTLQDSVPVRVCRSTPPRMTFLVFIRSSAVN